MAGFFFALLGIHILSLVVGLHNHICSCVAVFFPPRHTVAGVFMTLPHQEFLGRPMPFRSDYSVSGPGSGVTDTSLFGVADIPMG